jgi:hypothetical protein
VGDLYRCAETDAEVDAAWATYVDFGTGRRTTSDQQDALSRFLMAGLHVRAWALQDDLSLRLGGQEIAVYLGLRELHPGRGLRVCVGDRTGPGCFKVYEAQRAPRIDRCHRCHRSPIPWPPRPGDRFGWADPWDPCCRRLAYIRHCGACGREFNTAKVDIDNCANCRGAAARARRNRGLSAHGRQRFCYAREDGSDYVVSFTVDSQGHSVWSLSTES